jgi:cytochrome P450
MQVQSDSDHSRYRRLLSHAFSEKALREQEPVVKHYIDLLMAKLHENSGSPQDMVNWFNFVAFDIIGDLALGKSFSCLENAELHPWVFILFKYYKSGAFISILRRFPLLNAIMPMLNPKSLQESRARHAAFTTDKVLRRLEGGTDRPDFMSNVLMHNNKEVIDLLSRNKWNFS